MHIEGYFIENPDSSHEVRIKNTFVARGAELLLRNFFRAEAVLPADFYIGLSGVAYNFASVLTDLMVGEPVGNGYARQATVRGVADWDVSLVNNLWRARSKTVTFTATADWSRTYRRAFICSVAAGDGNLFAVSGPKAAQQIVLDGETPRWAYELWLRGA